MSVDTSEQANSEFQLGTIQQSGPVLTTIGLAIVMGWIGAMKFTAYEANAISGLVSSSPLTSWLYGVFDQQVAAYLIGAFEIAAAVLLIIGLWSARAGSIGALMVILTLLVTISFLFTAPVVEASLGFPGLSVLPGQFLLKDIALLGAAIWLYGYFVDKSRQA